MLDQGENREEVTLAFRFVVRNVAITSSGFSSYLLKFTLRNIWVFLAHVFLKTQNLATLNGSER